MASLGFLEAGAAPEINTPLTYVVTNLALIAERLPRRWTAGGGGDLDTRLAETEKALADTQAAIDYLVGGVTGSVSGKLNHDVKNWHTTVIFRLVALTARLARLQTDVCPPGQI